MPYVAECFSLIFDQSSARGCSSFSINFSTWVLNTENYFNFTKLQRRHNFIMTFNYLGDMINVFLVNLKLDSFSSGLSTISSQLNTPFAHASGTILDLNFLCSAWRAVKTFWGILIFSNPFTVNFGTHSGCFLFIAIRFNAIRLQ